MMRRRRRRGRGRSTMIEKQILQLFMRGRLMMIEIKKPPLFQLYLSLKHLELRQETQNLCISHQLNAFSTHVLCIFGGSFHSVFV